MAMTFLGGDLNPFSRQNRALVNIIILCTAVFLLQIFISFLPFGSIVLHYFQVTPDMSLFVYQPFSLVTYIFMHADFMHLFSNMLWLYFIGVILEDLTGRKHIWNLFLGGGIAGGLVFMLLYNLIPMYQNLPHPPFMVGASAGVSAIIVGTAAFVPRYRIYLFGIIGIELFWIALFRVVFDLLGVAGPFNQGGYMAHLGGAAFGLLYILHIKGVLVIPLVDNLVGKIRSLRIKNKNKPKRTARVTINNPAAKSTGRVNQAEIDRILDKINKSGYGSLTKEEKEALFRAGDS